MHDTSWPRHCAEGDANFLEFMNPRRWQRRLRTADQHEALKRVIRELRVSIEDRFGLASVQVRTQATGFEYLDPDCGRDAALP